MFSHNMMVSIRNKEWSMRCGVRRSRMLELSFPSRCQNKWKETTYIFNYLNTTIYKDSLMAKIVTHISWILTTSIWTIRPSTWTGYGSEKHQVEQWKMYGNNRSLNILQISKYDPSKVIARSTHIPENWTVAPRIESIMLPTTPAMEHTSMTGAWGADMSSMSELTNNTVDI